ncbi:MAG: DUF4304 domain-containing protein [Clostridia bacterium]|nr:DUF4304 domain-containing protein [Clostridia bacterium]
MANREIMLKALNKTVIKDLKAQGFTGKYPHFKKKKEDCIELVDFYANKYGGSFTVEVSAVFPDRKVTNLSDTKAKVDEKTVEGACTSQRYRLEGMFDGWFHYRDVYKLSDGFYEDIPENRAETFIPPEKWELVQCFDEKTAEDICEEISLQLDDAFEWLYNFERKSIKKNAKNMKPVVEEVKVFNKRVLVFIAYSFIVMLFSLFFFFVEEKGFGIFCAVFALTVGLALILTSPVSYTFSEEKLVINYFFGLKENIYWKHRPNVISTYESHRALWLKTYEFNYYSEDKRLFFMQGKVSKNRKTKALMEKYCPMRAE